MRRPPVAFSMVSSASTRAFSIAAFTAAATRSSSMPLSAGSMALGSMVIRRTSKRPFIFTWTRPPPASASTSSVTSVSFACSTAFSIFLACRMRNWMSMDAPGPVALQLVGSVDLGAQQLRRFLDVGVGAGLVAQPGRASLALGSLHRRDGGDGGGGLGRRGSGRADLDGEPDRAPQVAGEGLLDRDSLSLDHVGVLGPGREPDADLGRPERHQGGLLERDAERRALALDLGDGFAPALGDRLRIVLGRGGGFSPGGRRRASGRGRRRGPAGGERLG